MSPPVSLPRVTLETPAARHMGEFLDAVQRSRQLHRPWVRPPGTPEDYRAYLGKQRRDTHVGYLVRDDRSSALAGVVNVNEIVRGAFHSAYMGYYAFVPHEGRACMAAGLAQVIARAFGRHRLHRLEANIQPANEASIALVRRLGFRYEGYSPRYLKVGGRWCDHERWAILAEEWRGRRQA